MLRILRIIIKWLPAIISGVRELLKLLREFRQHRIKMKKLKKELHPEKPDVQNGGSKGLPEREPV
jgi:hypothetical protein